MKQCKRIVAVLLALLLTVGLVPLDANAAAYLPAKIQERISADLREKDLLPLVSSDLVPQAAYTSGTCGDNLTWVVDGSNLTISGTGDMYDFSDLDNPVPWSESRHEFLISTLKRA